MEKTIVNTEKKKRSIEISEELVKEVEKNIEKSDYKSLSEFLTESIRLSLETYERDTQTKIAKLQGKLFYTSKHIWAKLTPQGNIQLGVSEYFCRKWNGITHFETNKVGEKLFKGDTFATVETPAWCFIHDLCCPVEGEVVKFNEDVINDPLTITEDHHKWIVEIKPNTLDLDNKLLYPELLTADEYNELVSRFENLQSLPSDSE